MSVFGKHFPEASGSARGHLLCRPPAWLGEGTWSCSCGSAHEALNGEDGGKETKARNLGGKAFLLRFME